MLLYVWALIGFFMCICVLTVLLFVHNTRAVKRREVIEQSKETFKEDLYDFLVLLYKYDCPKAWGMKVSSKSVVKLIKTFKIKGLLFKGVFTEDLKGRAISFEIYCEYFNESCEATEPLLKISSLGLSKISYKQDPRVLKLIKVALDYLEEGALINKEKEERTKARKDLEKQERERIRLEKQNRLLDRMIEEVR